MIGLHLRLARRSLLRTPGFTAVMFVLLTVGVAGWYAPHIYITAFDRAPMAERRDLFGLLPHRAVNLPPLRGASLALQARLAATLLDGASLAAVLGTGLPRRETFTFAAPVLAQGEGAALQVRARFATHDFFAMFELGFAQGAAWPVEADAAGAGGDLAQGQVVLSPRLARRLLGEGRLVDRLLRIGGQSFRVSGVLGEEPGGARRIYDPGALERSGEEMYLPVSTAARLAVRPELRYEEGPSPPGYAGLLASSTGFLLYFAELGDAASRSAFLAAVHASLPAARLLDPREWHRQVLRDEGTIRAWPLMAGLTLLAAVLNLVRLLLAKFGGRHLELGLLRAVGASRTQIVAQLLLEASLIGAAAGVVGTLLGILVTPLAGSAMPPGLEVQVVSGEAVASSLVGAVVLAVLAAAYPAWKAAQPSAAAHLRRV